MLLAPPGMHLAMIQCQPGLELLHRIDCTAAEDADYGVSQLARALSRHNGGTASTPNLCRLTQDRQLRLAGSDRSTGEAAE